MLNYFSTRGQIANPFWENTQLSELLKLDNLHIVLHTILEIDLFHIYLWEILGILDRFSFFIPLTQFLGMLNHKILAKHHKWSSLTVYFNGNDASLSFHFIQALQKQSTW